MCDRLSSSSVINRYGDDNVLSFLITSVVHSSVMVSNYEIEMQEEIEDEGFENRVRSNEVTPLPHLEVYSCSIFLSALSCVARYSSKSLVAF